MSKGKKKILLHLSGVRSFIIQLALPKHCLENIILLNNIQMKVKNTACGNKDLKTRYKT